MRLAEVEYCGSPRPNWKWMAIAINTGLSLSPLLYSIAFAHWLPVPVVLIGDSGKQDVRNRDPIKQGPTSAPGALPARREHVERVVYRANVWYSCPPMVSTRHHGSGSTLYLMDLWNRFNS